MIGFSLDSAAKALKAVKRQADFSYIDLFDEENERYILYAKEYDKGNGRYLGSWDEVAEWLEAHRD